MGQMKALETVSEAMARCPATESLLRAIMIPVALAIGAAATCCSAAASGKTHPSTKFTVPPGTSARQPNVPTAKSTDTAPHLRGHGGPIKSIATSPAGDHLLTGSFDYSMNYWRLDEDGKPILVRRFDDHAGAVSATALFADGKRAAAASDDGTISVWSLETGKRLAKLTGHRGKILGLDISADQERLASASWDRCSRA